MMFFEMIAAINADGSRLYKESKVKEFGKQNPLFVRLLERTYSSEFVYGLRKVDLPKSYGVSALDEVWVVANSILNQLTSREITGNLARETVTAFLSGLREEEADVFVKLLKGDLRCGINAGTVNRCFPGTIPEYPYMRCSLREGSNIGKFDWKKGIYSQEKADGMYANVFYTRGGQVKITSRAGTVFANVEFKDMIEELDLVGAEGNCINGELLVMRNGVTLAREIGNGILNSVLKGGSFGVGEKPFLMVWDILPIENAKPKGKYEVRYANRFGKVEELFKNGTYIRPINSRVVFSIEEAFDHYVEMTANGYEGTVIKNPEGIWADGTSKDQIKMKVEAEVDLLVVGWNKGNGKNEKWFGSLIAETSCGHLQVNVSGFSDKDRERIFGEMDEWVGKKIITVRANSIMYAKNMGDQHRLFLPRMVEERLDKTEADTFEKVQQIFAEVMSGK